jgi:hypothetical protein
VSGQDLVEVRFTQRLLGSLRNATKGALQAFIHDHGYSLEGGLLDSAAKRVGHTVQGLLKTHPDVRNVTVKWRDEKCQAECKAKAAFIEKLQREIEQLQADVKFQKTRVEEAYQQVLDQQRRAEVAELALRGISWTPDR